MNTVTLEFNPEQISILLDFYADFIVDNKNPYAIATVNVDNCAITFFKSGKVVFQGIDAQDEANTWKSMSVSKQNTSSSITTNDYIYIAHGGSDEVGTGDYYGPICVAATYVDKDDIKFLIELGVKDSKQLSDEKILEIAPQIIKQIKYTQLSVDNDKYNSLISQGYNMNKIKAYLHNQALNLLIKKNNLINPRLIIDQFAEKKLYFSYLSNVKEIVKNVEFMTKAESISPAVAAASIIARYSFLQRMTVLEQKYCIKIPKGAGAAVDTFGQLFIKIHGIEEFKHICKYNFKNTEKVFNSLNNLLKKDLFETND